eukprot:jgi/Botrbrau1/12862/Bobra.0188s0005.1
MVRQSVIWVRANHRSAPHKEGVGKSAAVVPPLCPLPPSFQPSFFIPAISCSLSSLCREQYHTLMSRTKQGRLLKYWGLRSNRSIYNASALKRNCSN